MLCRELTKKFEEFIRGTISEALIWATESEIRGEFCLIIEGATAIAEELEDLWWSPLGIIAHVDYYMEENQLNSKDAIKLVAKDRGMQKRDVYQAYHIEGNNVKNIGLPGTGSHLYCKLFSSLHFFLNFFD